MSTASIEVKAYPENVKQNTVKVFLPAILGNIVEYYDYTLYGFYAAFFSSQFFPNDDPTVALIKTFGIFVAGSFSKPLGALIFGFIGDRYGRSVALKISMIGIAFPTALIGLMPSYESIGWFAPMLLLVCRILQGIFTAGESDGVRIFIYEFVGKHRPCFATSLTTIAYMIGIYLASYISKLFLSEPMNDWIWRIPFLIGAAMGLLVFVYRWYICETPEFTQYLSSAPKIPFASLKTIITKNGRLILITLLWCGAHGGGYHFYLVFFGNYLSTVHGIMTAEMAYSTVSTAILSYTLCVPLAGFLADEIGIIRLFKISLVGLLVAIILNGWMISEGLMAPWVMLLTACLLSFTHAPVIVLLLGKFQVEERYRGIGLGHALGSMLLSGTAPLIGLWIWKITSIAHAPLFYFAFLIGIGYLAVFLLEKETV